MAVKNLRSNQIISTFGIGQLINFPGDVSVILAGLNEWENTLEKHKNINGSDSLNLKKLKIIEPRLQKLLNVEYFLRPFPYKSSGNQNRGLELPAFRFPAWHYCTNIKCGRMEQKELNFQDDRVLCTSCSGTFRMIPVRFIAACSSGHIQDVPFREWVHNSNNISNDHKLKYISTGGSGDLGSIIIKCSCGIQKSLAGLMNVNKENGIVYNSPLASIGLNGTNSFSLENPNNNNISGCYCKGHKPWLGVEGTNTNNSCGNHLEVLIRGGSNVHYSNITSSLFIPEFTTKTNPTAASIIQNIGLEKLKEFYNQDTNLFVLKAVLGSRPEVINRDIDIDTLISEVKSNIENYQENNSEELITTELIIRKQEHKVLIKGYNSENGDLKAVLKNTLNYKDSSFLEKYFSAIVSVERLKETRVFSGFTRINQSNPLIRRELSTANINWLPATEVFGEGIFLEFNQITLTEWAQKVFPNYQDLIKRHNYSNTTRGPIEKYSRFSPEFILIHTFSHLLIKRLCFSSGYGSSSLRERIYFSNDEDYKMFGVLIYTSSGDAEGSLGGLVRQGSELYLSKLIKEAIEEARWCSADPVCSEIGQTSGQGPDNVNGSACHNCCLLSETSCELYNSLLDRATIVGSLSDSTTGYFTQ